MKNEINKRLIQVEDEIHSQYVEYLPANKLDERKQIWISEEDRLAIGETKCFDLETMAIVDYDNTQDLLNKKKEELRLKREPLLTAFDKYKSNVFYGIEEETQEQKTNILTWYGKVLDLNEEAINNPPEKIKYYL